MSNRTVYVGRLPGNIFLVFTTDSDFKGTTIVLNNPIELRVVPSPQNPGNVGIAMNPDYVAFSKAKSITMSLDKFTYHPTEAEPELAAQYTQTVTGLVVPVQHAPQGIDLSGSRPRR